MAELYCVFLPILSAMTPATTAALSNHPLQTLILLIIPAKTAPATATVVPYRSATTLSPRLPPVPPSPPTRLLQSRSPESHSATLWGTPPAAFLFIPAVTLQDLKR